MDKPTFSVNHSSAQTQPNLQGQGPGLGWLVTQPASSASHHTKAAGWLMITAFTAFFSLSGYWRSNPVFHDHWIYYGFQRNLPNHLVDFHWTYWATRLSVILPGAVVYRLLDISPGGWLIHTSLLVVTLWACWQCARQLFGERAGGLAIVLAGTNFFFVQAMASDYTEGYGLCYFFLCLAAALKAVRSPRRGILWACGAGAFCACLGLANIGYWLTAPIIVGAVIINLPCRSKPLSACFKHAVTLCFGAVIGFCGTLALADLWFNRQTGIHLWQPNLHFIQNFHKDETYALQTRLHTLAVWLPQASWLYWPILATLSGLVTTIALATPWPSKNTNKPNNSTTPAATSWHNLAWFTSVLILLFVICFSGRIGEISVSSRYWYYAVPFYLPSAILVMAGSLDHWLRAVPRLSQPLPALLVGLVGAVAISIHVKLNIQAPGWPFWFAGFITAGLVALGLLIFAASRQQPWLAAAALGLFAALQAPVQGLFHLDAARHPTNVQFAMLDRCDAFDHAARPDAATAVERTVTTCLKQSSKNNLGFWYDARSPLAPVFEMVNASFAYGRLVSKDLTNIQAPATGGLQVGLEPGRIVILLSDDPAADNLAQREFQRLGVHATAITPKRIHQGNIHFMIRPYRIDTAPEELARTEGRVRQ